ncbi:MAG: nuclear transport factor 2 family protein [Bacteroidota bacterium]
MKNVMLSILALFIFGSSQAQDKVRYTQQAPEIETTKAYFAAYNEGDWEQLNTFYAKDAVISHNTSGELTAIQLLGGFKGNLDIYADYKWAPIEEELERVINDKSEMWVYAWGNWTGTLKVTGAVVNIPTHHAFQFKDGKIVKEFTYYDTAVFNDAKKAVDATTNPPIHFIEMWTPTDTWKKLSQKERGEYMAGLAEPIQGLMEQGVEIISWGQNDSDTDRRGDYDFYAVWSFPNAEIKQDFEKAVEGSGWYKYFEQKNLAGKNIGVEAVMGTLIGM